MIHRSSHTTRSLLYGQTHGQQTDSNLDQRLGETKSPTRAFSHRRIGKRFRKDTPVAHPLKKLHPGQDLYGIRGTFTRFQEIARHPHSGSQDATPIRKPLPDAASTLASRNNHQHPGEPSLTLPQPRPKDIMEWARPADELAPVTKGTSPIQQIPLFQFPLLRLTHRSQPR